MNGYGSSDDHQPVTWLGGTAIYAAHLVVIVFVASMIIASLMKFAQVDYLLDWLVFHSPSVLVGQVWRVLTYGLVNFPTIGFVVDMAIIVWTGRELERFFGRRSFLRLYGCLYLLTPLLFTVVGIWRPTILSGESGALALFIAFATLNPNVPVFFNVLAKWVALILVGIYSLIALSNRDGIGLLSLWATTSFAFAYVRYEQGHFKLPSLSLLKPRPKFRVLPDLPKNAKPAHAQPVREDAMAEVDALLDKIAHSGISSLTAKERARLDAARENLKRKESDRPDGTGPGRR